MSGRGTNAEISSVATEVSAPFWTALAAGIIALQRCSACTRQFFYPREWCPHCWSRALEWTESSGRGVIYAATTSYLPFQGIPADAVPFAVGLVDLEEGVRVPARLRVADDVQIGDAVRAIGDESASSVVFVLDDQESP